MSDRLFELADNTAELFAKLVLGVVLAGIALFLVVTSAPVGLAFIFMVLSIARWVSR